MTKPSAKKRHLLSSIDFSQYHFHIAAALACIQFCFSFLTDHAIFDFSVLNWSIYLAAKCLLLVVLFLFWHALLTVSFHYKKYFFFFLVIFLLLLIVLWPGTWLGDDLKNFTAHATTGNFHYRLHYLTSLYYIIAYMIFPTTSAPVILNLILASFVLAYLLKNIHDLLRSRWSWLIVVPFFLPHTLFYLYYPNRPVIFGLLFVLLFGVLLIGYFRHRLLTKKKVLALALLTAILANLRSEAVYLVVLVPILSLLAYRIRFRPRVLVGSLIIVLIPFFIVALPQVIHDNFRSSEPASSRNLPTFISPLSQMLVSENFSASADDLANIDKVLNVSAMKQYATAEDVPCMWLVPDCIRPAYSQDDYRAFLKSFLRIVYHNKRLFLQSKLATFIIATSINGDPFTTYAYTESPVRQVAYRFLEGRTNIQLLDAIYRLISNLFIPLFAILLLLGYSLIRKKPLPALMSVAILLSAVFIFFAAPAAYFMYYFYLYLSGWLILTCGMGVFLSRKHHTVHPDYNYEGLPPILKEDSETIRKSPSLTASMI